MAQLPQNNIEDIFGRTTNRRPNAPAPVSREMLNQRLAESETEAHSGHWRMGIALIAVFLVVLITIFAIYLFRQKGTNVTTTSTQPTTFFGRLLSNSTATVTPSITDADKDGLSDTEEATLGTDPTKADTDGDGLTDREEVKVYKTNPLKADTDGDGIPDGQEIKQGTDPLNPDPKAVWPPRPASLSVQK